MLLHYLTPEKMCQYTGWKCKGTPLKHTDIHGFICNVKLNWYELKPQAEMAFTATTAQQLEQPQQLSAKLLLLLSQLSASAFACHGDRVEVQYEWKHIGEDDKRHKFVKLATWFLLLFLFELFWAAENLAFRFSIFSSSIYLSVCNLSLHFSSRLSRDAPLAIQLCN